MPGGDGLILVDTESAVGHSLAQPISDGDGRLLLNAGTELTRGITAALERRGHFTVYVEDPNAEGIAPEEGVQQRTRDEAAATVRQLFEGINRGDRLPLEVMGTHVEAILADLGQARSPLLELATLRSVNDYTYIHSANVCAYVLLLGTRLELGADQLRDLGLGALLHDVGKVFCNDLCSKEGPLTPEEWERVRRHPVDGYTMLRQYPEIPLFAAHIAYQHHERLDGSGYPRGLTSDRILPFAKIVGIADVFDAVTSDRSYARAAPPHQAMSLLLAGAGVKFDAEMVRAFAACLAVYPTGSLVLLSDNSVGVVSAQTEDPQRPQVRVLGVGGKRLERPDEVQLRLSPELEVKAVLRRLPLWLQ